MHPEHDYIKNILAGLKVSQIMRLEEATAALNIPRNQILREAVDLWFRAYDRRKEQEGGHSN